MNSFTSTTTDCLLIIDVQNDFCAGGALEVPDGDAVVPAINALLPQFSTIVLTQDWHPAGHSSFASQHTGKQPFDTTMMPYGEQTLWPDHCIAGSKGAAFHPGLNTDSAQMIVRKGFRPAIDSYSAFFENDRTTATGLASWLRERNVERVVCTGLALDFCVRYSAEDARAAGFETVVLSNACRGIDLAGSIAATLDALPAAGIVIRD